MAVLVDVVQAHQGTIDKFIGDAVMALFNTPLILDNHALHAVQSACKIREMLPEFHEQFPSQFRLAINFGIHTGMAVVGNVGSPQLMDYTAVGDTVNVAARLQDFSQDGQILISDATYAAVQPYVEAELMGERIYKGRQAQVQTYDVIQVNM